MTKLILMFFILFLSGCNHEANLFSIENNSDLLYMAEATNVGSIRPDDVRSLLTPKEMAETKLLESNLHLNTEFEISPPPIYKDFGELLQTNNYKLRIIFREGNDSAGRDYKFILRTYNLDSEIIDSYILASWIKQKNEYCFGKIDKRMNIEKTCVDTNMIEYYRLNSSGNFIKKSK